MKINENPCLRPGDWLFRLGTCEASRCWLCGGQNVPDRQKSLCGRCSFWKLGEIMADIYARFSPAELFSSTGNTHPWVYRHTGENTQPHEPPTGKNELPRCWQRLLSSRDTGERKACFFLSSALFPQEHYVTGWRRRNEGAVPTSFLPFPLLHSVVWIPIFITSMSTLRLPVPVFTMTTVATHRPQQYLCKHPRQPKPPAHIYPRRYAPKQEQHHMTHTNPSLFLQTGSGGGPVGQEVLWAVRGTFSLTHSWTTDTFCFWKLKWKLKYFMCKVLRETSFRLSFTSLAGSFMKMQNTVSSRTSSLLRKAAV